MTVADFMRDLPWGQEMLRTGREEGREEALLESLVWRLEERFGTEPDVRPAARHLATWPDHAAFRAVTAAASLDELIDTVPPRD